MKISVLMSLFTKENPVYFNRSLKSIWDDQIRKPDEVVIVEDGPITKELENVIALWQEKIPVFKVIKLDNNSGLAAALNEGVKHCNCDYIARMDTDDISLPERFKLQEDYLTIHPEVVVLGGGMVEFNDEDGELQQRFMPLTTGDIKNAICKTSPFAHPSVFIKKSLFEKGLTYNPKYRKYQDLDFWFRILAARYEVANLDKVIIKFRKDPFMYGKRSKTAAIELKISLKGIHSLYGLFTWRYIYPLIHYVYRLLPPKVCLFLYKYVISKYWSKQAK